MHITSIKITKLIEVKYYAIKYIQIVLLLICIVNILIIISNLDAYIICLEHNIHKTNFIIIFFKA
jgi:hypothetical protein